MFKGIDFFSDTVTQPTVAMKNAMIAAELGDEQKAEDPTTRKLEEKMAELLGHEAALFFPSATMANEIAIRLLCEPGDELIAAENCHLFFAEAGGPAAHSGVMTKPIPTTTGIFTAEDVQVAYRWPHGPYNPVSKLLSVENTTNMGGGIPWNLESLNSVLKTAKELKLKTHLDGARLFNASVKLKLTPKDLAANFDTVTICLSKGLGCPMGAVLVFAKEHYDKVRRLKQMWGGALRQSGIIAAAGIYALDHHIERLEEDHQNAEFFAKKVMEEVPQLKIENNPPATNMVFFNWNGPHFSPAQFNERCIQKGLRFSQVGVNRFRAVTHLDVSRDDVVKAIQILKEISHP